MKKVVIVGTGFVGAHIASSAIYRNISAEFLMIDRDESCEVAQVLDLKDSLMFSSKSRVECANFGERDVSDADIFVITAGARMKPGETRLDLVDKNTAILKSIRDSIGSMKPSAIVILVSNPVDVLTYKAQEIFGLPKNQIIGTGTLLDTARLRWRLVEKSHQWFEDTEGMVLGEHGDSSFVAWSTVKKSADFSEAEKEACEKSIRAQAYRIKEGKGATYFGISATTVEVIAEILEPTGKLYPLSVIPDGEYGLKDLAIGLPCKIGKNGIEEIVEINLSEDEKAKLEYSAQVLKDSMK